MRKILQRILHPPFRRFVTWYYKKPRLYRYKGLRVVVNPGVFPPHFILSTRILLDHLGTLPLQGKRMLDLGCGTGVLSLQAQRLGAQVTATDISPAAVANTLENASRNGQLPEVLESDLFEKIPPRQFDLILVNPPYYPREPKSESEFAWFCGEDFQYFRRLFAGMRPWLAEGGEVRMILSEDCAIEKILSLAKAEGFQAEKILSKRVWGERNFIFRIT